MNGGGARSEVRLVGSEVAGVGSRVHHLLAILSLAHVLHLLHIGVRGPDLALLANVPLSLIRHVHHRLFALGQEGVALLVGFRFLGHEQFQLISLSIWQSSWLLVDLSLQATDGELEQLVLPLGFEHLLMQEVALLLQVVRLAFLLFYFLCLLVLFFLHSYLVIPDALNSLL